MIIRDYLLGAAALLLFCAPAWGGARSLNVVFVDIGSRRIVDEDFFQSYLSGNLSGSEKPRACWERLVQDGVHSDVFGMISAIKRPPGLNSTIGMQIWRENKTAEDAARSILKSNFEYSPGKLVRSGGYDGMYIFKSDGKSIDMMSIGARGGASRKISIVINNSDPSLTASNFSYALCKIGWPLMVDFGA